MQTEFNGPISIQKLNEAREMVTITKQRRHIFLVETKRKLNADLQVVKFAKSLILKFSFFELRDSKHVA